MDYVNSHKSMQGNLQEKIKEVDTKISSLGGLVEKTDYYDAKMLEIEGKYFTTSDHNEFTSDILDTRINQKELISNIVKKHLT